MKYSIFEGLLKSKDAIKAKIKERKYYMFHHFGKRCLFYYVVGKISSRLNQNFLCLL